MRLNKIISICVLCAAAVTVFNGCAYRADLNQGNFIEQEAVDQLRQGMTPEQVRFILGTPMLSDSFDSSRWYYTQTTRKGWSKTEVKNLIITFQGGALYDVTGDYAKPANFYAGVTDLQKIDTADLIGSGSDDTNVSEAVAEQKAVQEATQKAADDAAALQAE